MERDRYTEERQTEGRTSYDDEGRDWSDADTTQGTPRAAGNHWKLRRSQVFFFSGINKLILKFI